MQRDLRKVLAEPPELPVFRPEVVAPLADAVGLVDGNIADAELLEETPESLAALTDETFGRDVHRSRQRSSRRLARTLSRSSPLSELFK